MSLNRVEEKTDIDHDVHYESVGVQTGLTLCNALWFLNRDGSDVDPIPTRKKVTCKECISIVEHIKAACGKGE